MATQSSNDCRPRNKKGRTKLRQPPKFLLDENKTQFNDLPTEILPNILSRLPITSILQGAKYTCKLWNLVITDPMFSELQMTHSLKSPGHLYEFANDSNLYFVDHANVGMKLPFGMKITETVQLDSCHGLLSYEDQKDQSLIVCNPITGDSYKIPTPSTSILASGFGYAPLSNKYKYIRFWFDGVFPENVAILTLGENTWKPLHFPCEGFWGISPVYLNGALYWAVIYSVEGGFVQRVVSFNLDTEKYRTRRVLFSGSADDFRIRWMYLIIFRGNVAFVNSHDNGLQVVSMLIDESEDIWVEKFRFCAPRSGSVLTLSGHWMNEDLCGMEKSDEKGSTSKHIDRMRWLSYNVDSGKYHNLQFPFDKEGGGARRSPLQLITHVGSLISPSKIAEAGG